jgi:hypothetical protein
MTVMPKNLYVKVFMHDVLSIVEGCAGAQEHGRTALMVALENEKYCIATYLIENGCDLTAQDNVSMVSSFHLMYCAP